MDGTKNALDLVRLKFIFIILLLYSINSYAQLDKLLEQNIWIKETNTFLSGKGKYIWRLPDSFDWIPDKIEWKSFRAVGGDRILATLTIDPVDKTYKGTAWDFTDSFQTVTTKGLNDLEEKNPLCSFSKPVIKKIFFRKIKTLYVTYNTKFSYVNDDYHADAFIYVFIYKKNIYTLRLDMNNFQDAIKQRDVLINGFGLLP